MLVSACGSDGNVRGVTPVMADTRGTYRLAGSSGTVALPDGSVTTFASYSSGTLRLQDSTFTRSVTRHGEQNTSGSYQIGTSVNTILNRRDGTFLFTSGAPAFHLAGRYQVTPDLTLRLDFDPFRLSDGTVTTHSETWVKESDSPWQ